jgi:RNA polymerase sigma-70 factor (sigma-E family)
MGTMSGDFAGFFAAAWPRLYPMAAAVAGERGAAEDALQAAFAKAYSRWDKVCAAEHPEAYVRRIVLNEIAGVRRYGFARRERPSEQLPLDSRSHDSPEADVVRRDEVLAALRALPPRQRAVLVLRYYEDLSEAEIARSLGCSRGTVKSQASAALASLRRLRPDLVPSGPDASQEEQ